MAINHSTIVLILIISYSLGLDLFRRSKIDTQETSPNVVSVSSLLIFEKSPPKHYLISWTIHWLIFTTQPNLMVESGVHPSLHPNCHQQTVFAKFNVQIYYPPPYPWEIWNYTWANTELIRQAITDFKWDRAFLNANVNEKVSIFSNTTLNILSNIILHETIVCDDKDPLWFNRAIKSLIQQKKDIR